MPEIVPYEPDKRVGLGAASNGSGAVYADAFPEPAVPSKSVRDYLAILRRQWWIFLGIALLATGVTWYRVSKLPTLYRASATIRLADRRDAVVTGDAPQQRMSVGRETDPLASQIQLLMSRAVARTAVDLKGLRLEPLRGNSFPAEIDSVKVDAKATADTVKLTFGPEGVVATTGASRQEAPYGLPVLIDGVTLTVEKRPATQKEVTFRVLPLEVASGAAVGGLQAQPRQKTDIVDLSYVGTDPYQAQRMVNAMAEGFVAYSTLNAQQQSIKRRVFLENQLRQTEGQLGAATGAFTSYLSGQRVFSSKTQGNAQEAGLIDIDLRRSQMAAEKKTYESLLAQALSSPEETQGALRILISSPGMASNPVVIKSYTQMTTAEQTRDSLLIMGAAPTNPDIQAINSRIAASTGQLLSAVRSQIQALDAQLAALDNLRAAGQTKIAAAPGAAAEEGQLEQQMKSVQTVADQLQADLQRAKMAEAVAAGQVEIVDIADHPGQPISNGVPRKLAMGILLGLLLGAVAAVLVDGMNTSIRKRADVERVLQVPSLAVIPRFAPTAGALGMLALPSRSRKPRGKPGRDKSPLVTMADSGSPGAEAYRTLRTNLMFSQAVQALRTVVVTSASPGEGKTTTVGNLGITFAQQNLRVLLIDCDLRRSRLHASFDLPRGPGLTELLLGQIEQDDAVKSTSMPGLYVLSAGTAPPNPSEMLGGQKMRAALQSLSEAFDLIIIDTPPLLAASDGAILATLCDGVVMVVKAGTTETEAAQQAMQQLKAVGARVVGAVLNDPDSKVPLYGTYYNYNYAPTGT